ncbi:MAG: hypothetical protein IPH04_13855 [Saprospirales bacterium]|nr:hypothetical protein [Saprospirales bacterium]
MGGVKMKKVGIFGAFDRINYGDFLFPLILKKILLENPDDKIETTDYGLVKKNLIGYGETHCKSVNQLYNDENNAIIGAGGDVLSADWKALFECIYGNKHHKNGIDGFAKNFLKGNMKIYSKYSFEAGHLCLFA